MCVAILINCQETIADSVVEPTNSLVLQEMISTKVSTWPIYSSLELISLLACHNSCRTNGDVVSPFIVSLITALIAQSGCMSIIYRHAVNSFTGSWFHLAFDQLQRLTTVK